MNNDNIIIPKYRFPAFKDDGNWEISTIKSLAEIKGRIGYRGYTTSDIVEKGKGAITLSPSNIIDGRLNFDKATYISWDKYDESPEIMLEEGHTVLVKTASVGKTAYISNLPEKTTLNPQIVVLKAYDKIDKKLLSYCIAHDFTQQMILDKAGAGAIPNLSQENIGNIEITYPTNPSEQKKIAACLSSLDDVIAGHEEKLTALEEHKKGLMQNLFPQEGQTQPKYRFPEFENDRDWVEKEFSEMFKIGNGRDYKHLSEGNIPVYGSGGLMLYVDNFLYDGESACIGRKGTIDKPMFLTGKFWTVDTLFYTYDFVNCLPKFIYYIFQNINWSNHNEAGGVPSLSKANIYKIKNKFPLIEEQQKIASVLSSLDELIVAQREKIDALKEHKKGLMQGLFPKIES